MIPDPLETPCFVCDLDAATARYRALLEAFGAVFPRLRIAYSYKTNPLPALCRTLHAQGALAEVVSGLEYRLARRLGVTPARVIFNGPAKSRDEVGLALDEGAHLNLDALEEVDHVAAWCEAHPARHPAVGLRVRLPLPEPTRGRSRSRFGLDPVTELAEAVARLRRVGARPVAVHGHVSGKARDAVTVEATAAHLADAARLLGTELRTIDVGGGFGHAPPGLYGLDFPDDDVYAAAVNRGLAAGGIDPAGIDVVIEPGISLVGGVMSCFTRVMAVKEAPPRRLLLVDASVHMVKPTRHRLNLPTTVIPAGGAEVSGPLTPTDVTGYTCMEDDFLAQDLALPPVVSGDVLRIDAVGAYTLALKPPFIRGAPAIHALEDGRLRLVRRPERLEDLLATDVDLDH